ncbi:MAG: hypothetical protein KIT14_07860 [bacterium]|nr:hypothetical protein [bacterium]
MTAAADDPPPSDALESLETLQAMLIAAMGLVRKIEGDPLLARWLASFHAMPAADRPVVIEAVEREVKASVVTRATRVVTGQTMHPNPHARLYLRSMERDVPRSTVETEAMRRATLRAMQAVGVVTGTPEMFGEWRVATAAALAGLDGPQRDAIEMLAREFMRILDQPVEAPPPRATPATPARSSRGRKSRP